MESLTSVLYLAAIGANCVCGALAVTRHHATPLFWPALACALLTFVASLFMAEPSRAAHYPWPPFVLAAIAGTLGFASHPRTARALSAMVPEQ